MLKQSCAECDVQILLASPLPYLDIKCRLMMLKMTRKNNISKDYIRLARRYSPLRVNIAPTKCLLRK